MIDVEVEPHADRVGGDQVIDVAGLEHRDLRVAGARYCDPSTGGAAMLAFYRSAMATSSAENATIAVRRGCRVTRSPENSSCDSAAL